MGNDDSLLSRWDDVQFDCDNCQMQSVGECLATRVRILNKALRIACGLASTAAGWSDKHPEAVLEMVLLEAGKEP